VREIFFVAIIIMLFSSCSDEGGSHQHAHTDIDLKEYRDSSTIQMAALLVEHYKAMPAARTNYKNSERADYFLAQGESQDINQHVQLTLRGSFELINAGRNDEALSYLNKLYEKIMALDFPTKNEIIFNIKGLRAITNFRIGELENCRMNHTSSSCIIPFHEESFHKLRHGNESAIKDILDILKIKRDPNFVYLLNVAYMTLGGYPSEVPKEYLVPLIMQEEMGLIKKFKNIGSELGVDDNKLSGGVIVDDFDNDGHLDIMTSSWNLRDNLAFYRNNGDGSFTESHITAGLDGITGGLNMVQADYNYDGYIDVFVLRGAWLAIGKNPNSLLRNNGDGTFTDVTIEAGLATSLYPTQSATWADFNNDGFLDLFIGNETFNGQGSNPCELFLNQGDGTFENIANLVSADVIGYIKGVASSDIDNDGDQDLFLSNLDNENILLRNDSDSSELGFRFTDISKGAGITKPLQSFPTWFFDYDNDGLEDLFVASYPISFYNNLASEYLNELVGSSRKSETPRLYKNVGDNKFRDVTTEVGLDKVCFTMGSNFGDFNNDGYQDIYLGTGEPDLKAVIPNRAFLNINGEKFSEVTTQAGLGHIQKGHGITFADLDNDGDQDIYAVMGGAYEGDIFFNALFENPGHNNSFIKLSLEGTESNRDAIGAKIAVHLDNKQTLYRSITSGSSFGGNMLSRQEIGIPSGNSIVKVSVIWPSGKKHDYKGVTKGNWYVLNENNNLVTEKSLESMNFELSKEHHHHHHN